MNSKERVRVAMGRGAPDCVPVVPQICLPHAVRMLGLEYEKTLLDSIRKPSLVAELTYECVKRYGVDGMRVWMQADPLEVVKVDGVWYGVDPSNGATVGRVDFEGGGSVVSLEKAIVVTDEDIGAIPVVSAADILKSGKLDGIKAVIEDAGDKLFVISAPNSFTIDFITNVRGKEQAMMDLMDDPEFCHRILERALQAAIQQGIAMAEAGIDAIYVSDTFGGVVSPRQFAEFSAPYFKRFVEAMKGRGPLIYMHVCGNSRGILEHMADTGVDCIEPLDPLGGVEVADAKRRVGDRVALMGGVNTVKLAHGSLQDVVDDCERCLSEGAPGGGYILAAGDMLPTETSGEKVQAMISAARNYRYE